jgi:DhnA-type fructose-1,6-bisphosphate aldolase and related enzymes
MPDIDGYNEQLAHVSSNQVCTGGFHVKGADHYDWGMKARLSSIFNPKSGNTVMLAFDHGYIMGPTTGLERLDLAVSPLYDDIDVFMATRGALRSSISPATGKAVALRCSAGSSVLAEDMSKEQIAVSIKDAVRMNAACLAVQAFIGSPDEIQSIGNICDAVDAGMDYGIPVLGVVAVGKQMERTTKYFQLATRMLAEFGAQIVKTYHCEDFESVVNTCPVPLVMAGGKKLPEQQALTMTHSAMKQGARGVDMGRNIFQAEDPVAMAKAVSAIVHGGMDDKRAYEFYLDTKKR